MSVYVEPLAFHGWRLHGRSVKSCHLIADNEEELHRFAQFIDLKRSWAHQSSFLHYDITAAKRAQAVACGAIELTRTEFVARIRRLKEEKKVAA